MPHYHVTIEEHEYDIELEYRSERYMVTVNGRTYSVKHSRLGESRTLLLIDNESLEVDIHSHGSNGRRDVFMAGVDISAQIEDYAVAQMRRAAGISHPVREERLRAPMPGLVVNILIKPGDRIDKSQPLIIVEAMKMENVIRAGHDGVIKSIHVSQGASIEKGDLLLEFE